jgi:hypothetical protein
VTARGTVVAVVCSGLALLPAGCGDSKLDTSGLEAQMQQSLAKRTGIAIKSVKCPDDVVAKKGDTFTCTATTARNERVVLNVTQDDGKGSVTWRIAKSSG